MPFIRIRGYLFGFFSREPPHELPHIHVKGRGGKAKLWLSPIRLVRSTYTRSETSDIVAIVNDNEQSFVEMWHERFRDR